MQLNRRTIGISACLLPVFLFLSSQLWAQLNPLFQQSTKSDGTNDSLKVSTITATSSRKGQAQTNAATLDEESRSLQRIAKRIGKGWELERDKVLREIFSHSVDEVIHEDPHEWFNLLTVGDIWFRDLIDSEPLLEIYDRISWRLNLSEDWLTRDEFMLYVGEFLSPFSTHRWYDKNLETEVDNLLIRFDRNGNGRLDRDEMSPILIANLQTWDINGDGAIDREEYREYVVNRLENLDTILDSLADDSNEGYFHRDLRYPAWTPAWFLQIDTDHDGQIGLYEWKHYWPISEFSILDLNHDGFLTTQELDEQLHTTGSSTQILLKELTSRPVISHRS